MPSYVKGQSETLQALGSQCHPCSLHLATDLSSTSMPSVRLSTSAACSCGTRFGKLFPWPPPWERTASSQSSDTRV